LNGLHRAVAGIGRGVNATIQIARGHIADTHVWIMLFDAAIASFTQSHFYVTQYRLSDSADEGIA